MFTSGEKLPRVARIYAFAGLGCLVFSLVYETYSHGVWSPFMLGLCLVPWLLGLLPAMLCRRRGLSLSAACRWLWRCGVVTLGAGCCLRGVFDIYGASVGIVNAYWLLSGLLLAGAGAARGARGSVR